MLPIGSMPNVKAQVESLVGNPPRMIDAERHLVQFLVQRLHGCGERAEPAVYHLVRIEVGVRSAVEPESRHVTKGGRRLQVQKRRLKPRELSHRRTVQLPPRDRLVGLREATSGKEGESTTN